MNMQQQRCHPERAQRVEGSAVAFDTLAHTLNMFGYRSAIRRTTAALSTLLELLVSTAKVAILLLPIVFARPARAHIGSPDVYAEGQAGPYKLSVVVRPPLVIPGVADIEVRAQSEGIDRITVTPVPLTGEASKHPPVADVMDHGSADTHFYTAHLWIMATGSWQIRFAVTGSQGPGVLSVPFPATAMSTRRMQTGMGAMLAVLGALLVLGMIGIVGAATREARLKPGELVTPPGRRRAYISMSVAFAVLVAAVILGNAWWKSEAANYSEYIYRPLEMQPALRADNVLDLQLRDPGWLQMRKLDDFIPDHDHLMHLYMIRWPQMDVVYHLHPEPVSTGDFQLPLPSMPAGTYRLYADVVHAAGFPETMVTMVTLPSIAGRPLAGDDAEGTDSPVTKDSGPSHTGDQRFTLPDGYTMAWKQPANLTAKQPEDFQFELVDPHGNPPADMALYMGMLGHAAFLKTDGTVFAHIHPTGTVAMAAFMMANPQAQASSAGHTMMNMPGMEMSHGALPNTVSFPYGFPSAGRYRIFVQMKHGTVVETGAFDATVNGPPS
jgi:hypothetical protein